MIPHVPKCCIDGTNKFDQCFLGLAICGEKDPCPVHFIVVSFKQKLLADFRDKTISQFTTEITKKGSVISLKDFDVLKKNNWI